MGWESEESSLVDTPGQEAGRIEGPGRGGCPCAWTFLSGGSGRERGLGGWSFDLGSLSRGHLRSPSGKGGLP